MGTAWHGPKSDPSREDVMAAMTPGGSRSLQPLCDLGGPLGGCACACVCVCVCACARTHTENLSVHSTTEAELGQGLRGEHRRKLGEGHWESPRAAEPETPQEPGKGGCKGIPHGLQKTQSPDVRSSACGPTVARGSEVQLVGNGRRPKG